MSIQEVLTSNLQKTIEVEIKTKKGLVHSLVPLNKNGKYKIRSLPVDELIKKFLEIKRHFVNQTFDDIQEVDKFLHTIDVSVDFREIGGNLAFGISSTFLKAFAQWENKKIFEYLSNKTELPLPLVVIADKEKTETDFKEFLLYPIQRKSFSQSVIKIMNLCNQLDVNKNLTINKILKMLSPVATKNSFKIGINFGASDLWNDRRYAYGSENLTPQEQLLFVQDIISHYPVDYIEDPFHEDDFVLFSTLTHRIPTRLVIGNKLYSNNFERFKRGIELKSTSAINISPTQMGTITDVVNLVEEARKNKISIVLSCETDDKLFSHLAVGLGFDYIKLGMDSISVNSINGLFRIENQI